MKWKFKQSYKNYLFEKLSIPFSKKYYFLVIILFIGVFSNLANENNERFNLYSCSYKIMIKINGTGKQNVISQSYHLCPNLIYLNEEILNPSEDCHKINIPEEANQINLIKLIWNDKTNTLN